MHTTYAPIHTVLPKILHTQYVVVLRGAVPTTAQISTTRLPATLLRMLERRAS